jgi:uncharacterized FlaG/YvyC family protein
MSNTVSLAVVPKPSAESDVLNAIDARQKLEDAIAAQKAAGETAGVEFAKTFARSVHAAPILDADSAVQKNSARKAAEDRTRQRLEALQDILGSINKLIEQLKYDSPEVVTSALSGRVEALEKKLAEKEADGKDLEEQIKKLKAELNKLPKAAAKKTSG